jgi:thiol-disulfide isomerase/thioredoxin
MNRTAKIITVLGLFLAVALGILYGKGLLSVHEGLDPPASLAALKLQNPPKPAPDVAFYDAAGGRHTLAEYRGRYVLMNFWATWCAPCVAELPALSRLAAFAPGLRVLAINTDRGTVDAAAFLKSHKVALPVWRDVDVTMLRSFNAYGLPMTVLIDPGGKIVAKAEGPADWASPEAVAYFKRITGS